MFANFKNRFISVIAPDIPPLPSPSDQQYHRGASGSGFSRPPDKFAYSRPPFLQLLTPDELRASADHNVRPIIVPRDINLLPWGTGYAECVNSGKSEWNEDQGAFCRQVLSDPTHKHPDLPYTYFGIFDGHAGYGAALAASHHFHHILHEKLVDCIEMLLPRSEEQAIVNPANSFPHPSHFHKRVSKDELITGALEGAFFHMDSLIAQDRDRYRDAGGCTACVALFIDGKLYVANAGDSRAVLSQRKGVSALTAEEKDKKTNNTDGVGSYPVPFSFDHTPETERQRLLNVARLKPNLLGKQYAAMEYAKRPHAKDLGQRILCRQGTMKGWTFKTLTREDLRMPVVTGEGKRSRLLGTLGVTRGFGDHDLLAINTGILIKPFLTPHPEVTIRDLTKVVSIPDENNEDGDFGVLIMATDGLWDVSENEAVARTVFQTLSKYPTEKHRYTMVAQELVAKARGKINDSGHWRLADSKAAATVDDISVIVVPVYQYYKEHIEWEKKCKEEQKARFEREAQQAQEAKENQSLLVNGVTLATVEVENDDEGNIAELNKVKEQSTIEIMDNEMKISTEQPTTTQDEQNVPASDTSAKDTNDEINTTATALEAINISTANESQEGSPQSSPEKSNKPKPQQQQSKNRNRKEDRKR
ncbi:protein phosphatase 1H [Teleopsis dalmanni]|uniref:protein phosphatase 1H n=1 Tax=Teleopsis dalmanni TaxID=139649 RepID=UPI0018CE8242|nr:protein phosphatase 1H [Teleopsis dalmanni]